MNSTVFVEAGQQDFIYSTVAFSPADLIQLIW